MCIPNEQYQQICKGEFAEINRKLDLVDEAIRGNSKIGLKGRMDRLEILVSQWAKVVWIAVGALVVTCIAMLFRVAFSLLEIIHAHHG